MKAALLASPRPLRPRPSSIPISSVPPVLARPVRDDDLERRPGAGAVDEGDAAAMRAGDLGGDGKAESGAAGAGAALEGLEEMAAGAFGDARTGIADADADIRSVAGRGNGQPADDGHALVAALQRLDRIAAEIDQDAEELVWVGID